MKKGFTLIELLIVVLIIAILAAIAVPNFLEFQTRAKVSRVKSDMRSLATAIEAYFVDNNEYPSMASGNEGANSFAPAGSGAAQACTFRIRVGNEISTLTTPIGYISGYFGDAFAVSNNTTFQYRQYKNTWLLWSWGPDRDENENGGRDTWPNTTCSPNISATGIDANFITAFNVNIGLPNPDFLVATGSDSNAIQYDPTNGTTSEGDVLRNKQ